MIHWHSFTKESRRLNPHTGAVETRFTTYLAATPRAYHILSGHMGIATAEVTAEQWNLASYTTNTETTKAAADYGREGRKHFHLRHA